MNWNFQEILTKDPSSAWGCDTSGNIPRCGVALRRTCRCTEFHRVKNANLRDLSLHSCNVKTQICVTRLQCVNIYHSNNLKHIYLAVGELKVRIIVGNKCYHTPGHILKTRYITHPLRVGLYKIAGPVVTNGPGSWTFSNTTERVLMTWQSKMLGKTYGTTYDKGFWRIKMKKVNQKVYNKFKSPDFWNCKWSIKVGMAWACCKNGW